MQIKSIVAAVLVALLPLSLLAKAKQPITVPEQMKIWSGFFDPQIRVHSTTNEDEYIELRADECKYIFPTWTTAYIKHCPYPNDELIDSVRQEKCGNGKEGTVEFICAQQMSTCNAIWGTKLGCIKIPDQPPPPPFYDFLPPVTTINIVPDLSSSYADPKIRAIFRGELKAPRFPVSLHGKSDKRITYNYKTYDIKSFISGRNICATNPDDKSTHCFRIPDMEKPEIKGFASGKILYNGGERFEQFYPRVDLDNRNFKGGVVCKSKSEGRDMQICPSGGELSYDKEDNLVCSNGRPPSCDTGYKMMLDYVNDFSGSNVACLRGWTPDPAEYVLLTDPKRAIFKEESYAFVPYKKQGASIIKDNDSGYVQISNMKQSSLDNISSNIGGTYFLSTDGRLSGKVFYRYEQVINIKDGGSSIFLDSDGRPFFLPDDDKKNKKEYSINICDKGLCYVPIDPYLQGLCAFINPIARVTIHRDFKDSNIAYNKEKISVADFTLPKIDTETTNKEHRNTPKYGDDAFDVRSTLGKCDFLTMEAIGGGASSNYTKGMGGNTFSGSSGAYTKATINFKLLQRYKSISVFVGKGGISDVRDGSVSGGDTKIYLCKDGVNQISEDRCDLLLKSDGGLKERGEAKNNNAFSEKFSSDLIYKKSANGVMGCLIQGVNESPFVPIPNIAGGIIRYDGDNECQEGENYLKYEDSQCEKDNIIPGMGGCVSTLKGEIKSASGGMVRFTCERWTR